MADILDFRTSSARSRRAGSTGRGETGEIVIFPGVRYERWESAGAPAHKAAGKGKTRRKRDVLEIED